MLHLKPDACASSPIQCNVEGQKKVRDVFSTLYVGWGKGRATCTLNLVRIFVLRVFKDPQGYICPKNFVHFYVILNWKKMRTPSGLLLCGRVFHSPLQINANADPNF